MPTISRPILIALVLSVVAAVGFYATQGGDDATEAAAPVIPTTAATDVGAEPPAGGDEAPGPRQHASADDDEQPSARKRPDGPSGSGIPAPVRRALGARKLVVLFFYERRAADDRATARAVAALRGQPNVAVFTDPIARIARYRGLIGELGISQAPAVVILGRGRTARVIEGYIDPATLAQDVADAR